MEGFRDFVGHERSLQDVSRALHAGATSLRTRDVGAMHVTCADESEDECVEAFQQGFVRYLLPRLKFARHSAVRLATLGGRYEWGAVRTAHEHYAAGPGGGDPLLMLVKINAHVSAEVSRGRRQEPRFGVFSRYGAESRCCSALAALLEDTRMPFAEDLREVFQSEGVDRIATLVDPERVDQRYRPLYASIVSARLQMRKVVLDIQDFATDRPTYFAVVGCVTLNRPERDTELACGLYVVDGRRGGRDATYFGLGDDPSRYEATFLSGRLTVRDGNLGQERRGRDHRALALEEWRRRAPQTPELGDNRLERIQRDMTEGKHRGGRHAKALLGAALLVLGEVAPIPAAVLLFAAGAVKVHHAFRIHRLTRDLAGSDDARRILNELHAKIDQLDSDRAEVLLEMLMKEYRQ